MAEVADFHISSLISFEEEEVEAEETLGSISYWPYDFDDHEEEEEIYSSITDPDLDERRHFGSDSDSVTELNDFLHHDDDDDDEVINPISDLLERCLEHEDDIANPNEIGDQDPFFRVFDENNEIGGSSNYLDLGLGLGLGRIDEEGEGLRVVGIGSDSDEEVGDDIFGDEDGLGDVNDDIGVDYPICWDRLRLEDDGDGDPREVNNEFFEWEDVGGNRVDTMDFEERSVSAMMDIQEMVGGREETMRNLDWQVLLQVNNLERNVDAEAEHGFDDHDDYIYPAEYEMQFGQFAENENAIHGSPPTAKSVVENLPSIVLTQDDLKNKGSLCAVCKDEINTVEQVKLLPCSHYYHGDCILPWLNIRNTCPVCRFELPTDDPEYEQRRTQRAGRDSSGVSQRLHDLGARRVLVTGTGPIGCVPAELAQRSTNGGCSVELQRAAGLFNPQLVQMIKQVNSQLGSDVFIAANTNQMHLNFITNPQSYGFVTSKIACCGQGPYNGVGLCTAVSNLCPNRDLYAFWDPFHPSEKANRIIVQQIMSGSSELMHPMNLSTILTLDSKT